MPVKSNDGGFPIRFSIPAQRVAKKFDNAAQLGDFLREEVNFWQALNQPNSFGLNGVEVGFLDTLTTARFGEAQTIAAGDPVRAQELEANGALFSEGIHGKLLLDLKAEKPRLYPGAAAAIAANLGKNIPWPDQGGRHPMPWPVWLSGLGGLLELRSPIRASKAESEQLDMIVQRAQDLRHDADDLVRKLGDWQAAARHEEQARVEGFTTSAAEALEAQRAALEHLHQSSNTRISDLEVKVRKRLVLEAPTTYWTNKADGHRTAAILFSLFFVASLVSGIYWLTHNGVDLVASAYERIVGDRSDPGLLALVPLAFITLPTLAFAWLLRHVSRVIVQNLALGADARLRGTIATTYSALTAEQAATPAELAIALHALFRPLDGSTHSEIAPPNLQDILEMSRK